VVAFPSMSRQGSGRRMHMLGLAMVLAIGVVTVLGVAVLSSLAVVFIGGPEYAGLQGRLWVFAALGTLLAILQLMIYDVVARQHQRMVFVVWAAMAVLLVAAPFLDSVSGLLVTVVSIDAALFVALLLASLRTSRPAETQIAAKAPVP
jgi:O-antigen/teichoic acid export membrane protein